MIPAIIAAAGRMLGARAASAFAGRGATAAGTNAAGRSAFGMARRQGFGREDSQAFASRAEQRHQQQANEQQRRRFNQAQDAFNQLSLSAAKAATPLKMVLEPIDQLTAKATKLSNLVRLVNPGTAHQADLAIQNLYASIGKHLSPALRGLTTLMNSLNKVISGMGPALAPMATAIGKFLVELSKTVEAMGPDAARVAHDYARAIGTITDAMRHALPILKGVAAFLADTGGIGGGGVTFFKRLFQRMSGQLPESLYQPNEFTRKVGVPGVATTSQQIYDQAAMGSLQASNMEKNTKQSIPQQQLTVLEEIRDWLTNNKWAQGGGNLAVQAGQAVGQAAANNPQGAIAGPAGFGINEIANLGDRVGRKIAEALFTR